MSNLAKLEFLALDITGKNYLSWILDAEIHLAANGLGETIKTGNKCTDQEKAKAMIFLRHHLHEALKNQYLTVKDPLVLWNGLKDPYDHLRTVILPKARYEWSLLRLQDFKSVSEYNSAMFRITSLMNLCGEKITDEEMLERTFSTFHASNIVLQQQYRERKFKKYSDLISCLLLAEQNNELLMKNHETRPTGSAPLPETNVTSYNDLIRSRGRGNDRGHGRGHGGGRGGGRGRGNGRNRGRGRGYGRVDSRDVTFKHTTNHRKGHDNGNMKNFERGGNVKPSSCYRCGSINHWARACRTPKHLVELYEQSLKKGKGAEVNFVYDDGKVDSPIGKDFGGHEVQANTTHLDVGDFLDNE